MKTLLGILCTANAVLMVIHIINGNTEMAAISTIGFIAPLITIIIT